MAQRPCGNDPAGKSAPTSRLALAPYEWAGRNSSGRVVYDVLADGVVIGRIMRAAAALEGMPWIWTLIFGYHEDRSPTHGL
jgi:hypothetical protein